MASELRYDDRKIDAAVPGTNSRRDEEQASENALLAKESDAFQQVLRW